MAIVRNGMVRVVRAWLQLTDNPGSCMILRPAKDDRDGEVRAHEGGFSAWERARSIV